MPTKNKEYLASGADVFDLDISKSQKQQLKIVEAAIASFAKNGIEKTTYTSLAKQCRISRPLIHHYFPTLDSLFLLAARFARETLLKCALEKVAVDSGRPEKFLESYIDGCFNWVERFPDQAKFWMLYFYQASLNKLAHDENSELVGRGQARLEQLLKSGQANGVFKFEDAAATAKTIQILITGGIVGVCTETGYLTLKKAKNLVKAAAFSLVGRAA